jgi:hypothetical protein
MSLSVSRDAQSALAAGESVLARRVLSVPGLVAAGLVLSVILTLPTIRLFMTTGFFLDPDDAMRLAQVRDFMDGQGWFDMTAWRLDPPHGTFMHWTRGLDAPMAVLIRSLSCSRIGRRRSG